MSIKKLKVIAALLAGVVLVGLSPTTIVHADSGPSTITDNVVQITETISPEGFKHPGIRFTKESLENLRAQVIAGQEPWASYYEGMRRRHWASLDYGPRNHNGNGYPAHDVISHNGLIAAFVDDAQAALMHSVQYVVTGDERHRAKAMYIVGVYSNMNPNGVEYFADAHIKMGQPIYHMTAAAEILRATSTTRPELEWTEELTYNYVHNFLQPQADAYIRKNHYFMNQYSYALIGNVASAIFADDRAAYEEAVEWATVGSTAENQGWVGSFERQFRLVTHNDKTGEPVDEPHVQLVEMGRDQAHGIGNVDSLFIISQIISSQGTRVDPVTGTASTSSDAIEPVHFRDDALRKAYIEFVKYNVGYDIRWTPTASSILADGTINSVYKDVSVYQRGRLRANVHPALYYYYAHTAEGYDLDEGENRFIKLAWEKNYDLASIRGGGYWGPREHVYDSEFWMHLPPSAADTSVPARGEPREILDDLPEGGPWYIREMENRHMLLDGVGEVQTEGDVSYLSVEASPEQPANFTLLWTRFRSGMNAFKIRTNGPATIEFTRGHHQPATSSLYLPDTGGQWRYIPFDTSLQYTGGSGDMSFVRVVSDSGTTVVDFDHLNRSADNLEPPIFETLSTEIVTYAGGSIERAFPAPTEAGYEPYYFTEGDWPAGASIDSGSGAFSWAPAAGQEGQYRIQVIAEDDIYMASHQVDITVLASAKEAADYIAQALDPDRKYESATREVFYATQAETLELIEAGATAGEIETALAQFLVVADALLPLNPAIPEDVARDELGGEPGSVRLDYPNMVVWSNTGLGHLVDGDSITFNSRWVDPTVTMDFGVNFRIRPAALHIQARAGFPDRLLEGRLEGSNDGENWVRLTDDAAYGEDMQRLVVYPEYQDSAFRYLRAISENCPCPVFDLGEMYLFGERKEVNSDLASALPRWFAGDTLEIPVDTTYPQSEAPEFSFDLPAGAVFDTASSTIRWTPGSDQTGEHILVVTADYGYDTIVNEIPITVSADASTAVDELVASIGSPDDYTDFSLQMLERAAADARAIAEDPDADTALKIAALALLEEAVSLLDSKVGKIKTGLVATILASHHMWGNPDLDPTVSGLNIFDGDYTTGISLQDANHAWVQADYGEGRYVSLTQVKLTPRSGQATRLNGASISGSNDGENWTLLASLPTDAYSNRNDSSPRTLQVEDSSQYRYLRYNGGWGSHADAAEVEYFGTTNADVDDRTLAYLITKAEFLTEGDWTAESWQGLMEAVAAADSARDGAALAEATEAVDAALNALIPASGNLDFEGVPERWFVGESLEFSIFPDGAADQGLAVDAVLPDGATFDPISGQVSWTPGDDQLGKQTLRFTVTFDDKPIRLEVPLPVTIFVDASAAVDDILATVGPREQYTSFSQDMLARAESDAREIAEDPLANPYRKLSYLELLDQAVSLLESSSDVIDVSSEAEILGSHHRWGNPSEGVSLSGLPAFDGNASTFVDMQSANGTWVQADFGEGHYVSLTWVRLTPRRDYGSRLNNASIAGSNDGENWTTLARVPGDRYLSASWDNKVTTLEISDSTEYRYVRFFGADGSHGNVADIELFGTHNFGYDDRTLPYLMAKAGILLENDWSADSWQYLMDTLAAAQEMIEEGGSEALYALATDMLDDALNTLVPAPSYLDFVTADAQASEADGSITLWVSRTGGSLGPVSANFATLDGSASAGEDFANTEGTLTWADGDMSPKSIVVSLIDDGYLEDTEDFTVKLETADNGVIGDLGEALVILVDDDADALPGVSISDASLVEGDGKLPSADSMQFEVSLSGAARQPASVLVRTHPGTAQNGRDFIPMGQEVHFDIGEKRKIVEVRVRPDDKREGDEQFTLEATWSKGAEVQDGVGIGTILDDD